MVTTFRRLVIKRKWLSRALCCWWSDTKKINTFFLLSPFATENLLYKTGLAVPSCVRSFTLHNQADSSAYSHGILLPFRDRLASIHACTIVRVPAAAVSGTTNQIQPECGEPAHGLTQDRTPGSVSPISKTKLSGATGDRKNYFSKLSGATGDREKFIFPLFS